MYLLNIIYIFSFLYGVSNYNNIYSVISDPRNISLGNMHISSNDVSSIFDSPIAINNKKNNFFISLNQYSSLLNVYHVAYTIIANDKMNLSFGLVRREINNNYNTNLAWYNDGYPDQGEIDYSQIFQFSDKETGLLLSYNKILDDIIIGFNFKPSYHKIGTSSAVSFQMDCRYSFSLNKVKISFGVDNLLSRKKWDTGYIERTSLDGYINGTFHLNQKLLFFGELNIDKEFKLGTEMQLVDNFHIRSGINKSNFTLGFGVKTKNFNIDYAYVDNGSNILGNNHSLGCILKLNNFK